MGRDTEVTEEDFQTAFSSKFLSMQSHKVPFTWESRAWLLDQAEVTAAHYATIRTLYGFLHPKKESNE
jgi:hypothetical protein